MTASAAGGAGGPADVKIVDIAPAPSDGGCLPGAASPAGLVLCFFIAQLALRRRGRSA